MAETTTVENLATMARRQHPLACRLGPTTAVGRQGPIPYMGEMELENCSDEPLEIEYTMTPLQYFELEIVGPAGIKVSEGHFSDRFSPALEPHVLRLMPGEKFSSNVSLLATLPRERRFPGRYTIHGSYCFQGRRVLAEPVTVDLVEGA